MISPEEKPVAENGTQVSAQIAPQPATMAPETPTEAQETKSYFENDDTLKKRINELTQIAESGNQEEIQKAMVELGEIEQTLTGIKEKTVRVADVRKEGPVAAQLKPDQAPPQEGDRDGPKKFTVTWQGKKIEREDVNNLLGFKSTGELKAALVKAQAQLDELTDHSSSLTSRLRDAEEKIRRASEESAANKPPPQQTPSLPAPPKVIRPTLPKAPVLSTGDPALYTEEDIGAVTEYQNAMVEYNQKLLDYVASLESHSAVNNLNIPEIVKLRERLDIVEKGHQEIENEKRKIAEEKADIAHWKQFSDFQDKHPTYKTVVPLRQLNDDMNDWMDKVAAANGVSVLEKEKDYGEYSKRRAQAVMNYLNNDSQTIENAKGLPPPEDYQTFFKLLELNNAKRRYVDNGELGSGASLDRVYLLHKQDTGEIEQGLESIRIGERTRAAEGFASEVQQLQQHAVNIDPKQSAAGPDVNELGISTADLRWFQSVTPEKAHELQSQNRELFNKWNAIADAIVKKYSR
jgi:hypothetical protein